METEQLRRERQPFYGLRRGYGHRQVPYSGCPGGTDPGAFPLGKPLVTLVIAGRAYCIEEIEKASDAVFICFYPGPMGGKPWQTWFMETAVLPADCRPLFRVMSDSFLSITTPGLLPPRPIGIWKACLSTPLARA